ncbi:hypothetical protein PHYSODRAFT_299748 [Phytophthora sojae]|uniref:Uncharacterized protein n=1 Tax=Phytophthora sojae (strain P6497) TaxID=1094619 RepID=G4Z7V7_PHYSP|nr:hypothetical protein PHYSODRAFT_299748 [Phytophthora sojae]EGZ22492.1 hypothetical protein PHYSODRAFT_299748 [Phytophthora sojae]|eukprot:XP_009525209.1 hypothetical protein PHYSODRAFT_299748 [Phytophthora sojae]
MNTSSSAFHECASPTEPPTSEPSDPVPFPKRDWSEQDTLALATAWCVVYKAGVPKDEKTAMTNSRIFDAFKAARPSSGRTKKAANSETQAIHDPAVLKAPPQPASQSHTSVVSMQSGSVPETQRVKKAAST